MTELPPNIADVVARLSRMTGVVAVVLGGSRAAGTATERSDWDLGVYYRGAVDTTLLSELGQVHPPGSWGRVMNGGAWLTVAGAKVDVLLRDLDVVEHWCRRAEEGEYEVDALLGYIAGIPTYSLLAERAVAVPLVGALVPIVGFPAKLAAAAPPRWRFHAEFSLAHARMRAEHGDVVGAVGHVAKAVVESAHAVLCARGVWQLNEKQIVDAARLASMHDRLASVPHRPDELVQWTRKAADALGFPSPR